MRAESPIITLVQVPHFEPLTKEEIADMLKKTANKMSPGASGFGWQMIKWAWPSLCNTLTNLYNTCLSLGYHPTAWKEAIIVVLPKLDRLDYTLPKAHHPISLLECLGKLLEKVVAQCIQHNLTTHSLLPINQFGGWQHLSCLDAGLSLLHDIHNAH